jgi:hypothetical protein
VGPLSRAAAVVVLAALLGGHAFAHGGRGQHVHVMPAGSAGADGTIDAGTCSGTSRPAAPPVLTGPPFDLKLNPVSNDWRPIWTNAGYRFDDAGGRILRADGKSLPDGEYRRLEAPFDAASEPVEAARWLGLMTQGVRLDEKTCFFLEPGNNHPVTRLEMAALQPNDDKSYELTGLSNLRALLRGLPGDKAIPADVAARLKASHAAGAKLPQKVLDALAKGAPARELLADTDVAYASLTRYFDAQRDGESLVRSALPYAPGINEPAKPRALVGAVEERLAAALSKDLAARFATHEAGREMLEHFRDKDGVVRLPVVRVLKLSQRPDDPGYGKAAAIQDPSNGSVIINHWVAARIAVAAAPPEQREALAREYADASKLNARMLKDPDLRLKVLKGVEIIVAHEFIHAWQNRRSRYDVEMMRGNLPGANPLEKEQEAYREEYRYFHSLLKTHPVDAALSSEMIAYRSLLSDYDGFRANITQLYTGAFAGSSDFKTVAQVQEDRRSLARRLRGESVEQWVRQGLKLVGYSYGDKAMREAVSEDARRASDFRDLQLPRMKAESEGLLVVAFEKSGRPDLALGLAVERKNLPRADTDRYYRDTVARLGAPTDPLYDRVRAIQSVEGYARYTGQEPPKALAAAIRRDYSLIAEEWLGNAEKARTPEEREAAFKAAEGFAGVVKDPALFARVRAAREKKK